MIWLLSHRFAPAGVAIADRHYNRRAHGSPQFVPPGRCLVLITPAADALWVTSWPFAEYVRHRWPGAWVCSLFRNEAPGSYRSSDLIVEAVAATRWRYGPPPPLGIVTFLRAGWLRDGETEGGLVALRCPPERMPPAEAPGDAQGGLFASSHAAHALPDA